MSNGTFTDPRDGKVYRIKMMPGGKIWMVENLAYNAKDSKCYDDDENNCQKFGRLYDWGTAMNVAPQGWHLPTKTEWDVLMMAVGCSLTAGTILKSKSSWNGTDNFDFSALPGGYCNSKGEYNHINSYGYWWSANDNNTTTSSAHYYYMDSSETIYSRSGTKSNWYSVRCVKD
jgi:uncharacterized protein (TIGR02145 family)